MYYTIEKMQKVYEEWLYEEALPLDETGEIDLDDAIESRLEEIANGNGYEYILKDPLVIVFKKRDELLFAWHNDHDRSWSYEESGFDPSAEIEDLWKQDIITEECYRQCILETIDFEVLPKKLREGVKTYLRDPEEIDKNQYQNIYHNLYQKDFEKYEMLARKYSQKAKLIKFFNQIHFV